MTATFLADECFSGHIVRALCDAGFDIARAADTVQGADDIAVLALAVAQGRILLTEDTDFGELAVRMGIPTLGIVRFDLQSLDRLARCRRAVEALNQLGDQVRNALVTIEPTRARIRPL